MRGCNNAADEYALNQTKDQEHDRRGDPGLRDHTWVIVEGHDPKNWGVGGKPWPVGEMPPGPA